MLLLSFIVYFLGGTTIQRNSIGGQIRYGGEFRFCPDNPIHRASSIPDDRTGTFPQASTLHSILRATVSDSSSGDAPKLDFDECYYEVLECDVNVDAVQLKKKYYKLVTLYHPDNKNSPEEKELSNKQMMVINGAYAVLRDPAKRAAYDAKRRMGFRGAKAGVKQSGVSDTSDTGSSSTSTSSSEASRDESTGSWGGFATSWRRPSSSSSYSSYASSSSASGTSSRKKKAHFDGDTGAYANDEEFDFDAYYRRTSAGAHRSSSGSSTSTGRGTSRGGPPRVKGRGDGSLRSLRLQLQSIRDYKQYCEQRLRADQRDWGEVVDEELVEQRLRDIREVQELALQISDLEDEIDDITYRTNGQRSGSSDDRYSGRGGGGGGDFWERYGEDDAGSRGGGGGGDSGAWWESEPQPQTQPDRQRGGGGGGSSRNNPWRVREQDRWGGGGEGGRGRRSGGRSATGDNDPPRRSWRDSRRR